MRINQRIRQSGIWRETGASDIGEIHLVLVFSSRCMLADPMIWTELRSVYPHARIVACSTAGEINDVHVTDDTLSCTAIHFESSHVEIATAPVNEFNNYDQLGIALVDGLPKASLVHVLVFSDGSMINGSRLVDGIAHALPEYVGLTGGLAGDGTRFGKTAVSVDHADPASQVAVIGLYGSNWSIGSGSAGGWDAFGIERLITKARGNVLYEIDGTPALDLYKRYLGDKAKDLPSSALRFPLAIRSANGRDGRHVVRTILSVDEVARSMTFAGEIPEGHRARLMSANVERLIDGAREAALRSVAGMGSKSAELAVLISCVGRRLVLKQRVEEELEAVREGLGPEPVITGFYAYGEISPFDSNSTSQFHNQTMAITTLSER